MGTNYYLHRDICSACGRSEREHIGKASGGWTFDFRGSEDVRDYSLWLVNIDRALADGGEIRNEYEEYVSREQMIEIVRSHYNAPHNHAKEYSEKQTWTDADGNSFSSYDFS